MADGSYTFLSQYSPTGIVFEAQAPIKGGVSESYTSTGIFSDSNTMETGGADAGNNPISLSQLQGGNYNGIFIVAAGQLQSPNFVSGSSGWQILSNGNVEFNAGTFRGALVANSIDIPNTTTTNSFHVDNMGNTWWGATTFGAAPASVSKTGAAVFSNVTISGVVLTSKGTFGGDGSDGALSISGVTTTIINAAGANVVVKNYTSISITGSAGIVVQNTASNGTILILKSQGNVTLTSSAPSIDHSSGGGIGGSGGTSSAPTDGTKGYAIIDDTSQQGLQGVNGPAGNSTQTGGAGGAVLANTTFYTTIFGNLMRKCIFIACGSGGGGGGSGKNDSGGTVTGGAGGVGGGGLLIECAGALNFTGTIDIYGENGHTPSDAVTDSGAGGGGGGACGMAVVVYNTLTANTGTFTARGGTGGNGSKGTTTNNNSGGSGGGGGAFTAAGGNGGTGGAIAANGGNGVAGTLGAGGGGGGGGGGIAAGTTNGGSGGAGGTSTNASLVIQNTAFT